jgi:hypothetical protein
VIEQQNNRNPYDNGTPELKRSVFCLVDILGYTEMITKSSQNPISERELLRRLHTALAQSRNFLESISPIRYSPKDSFYLKAFTDNIAIGWPIIDDAEMEFGMAFPKLQQFQLTMANNGFFVRGAISVNDVYIDEITVFGNALTEAYKAEQSLARDPRIIMTKSAVEVAKKHIKYYANELAPHAEDLLKDSDGQWFLSYLQCAQIGDEQLIYDLINKHQSIIEEKLKTYRDQPNIWSKYAWVANYHNYFCETNAFECAEYIIDMDLFRARPTKIIPLPID